MDNFKHCTENFTLKISRVWAKVFWRILEKNGGNSLFQNDLSHAQYYCIMPYIPYY